MPKRLSPAEFQVKQATRLKAATKDIIAGVEATSEAPSIKAVAKQEKMLTNLTAAVNDGKWARRLGEVSLADWKRDMVTKGVQRIPAGIDGAAEKVRKFASVLLPHAYAVSDAIKTMPDMTLEDNINRAVAAIRGMSELKYK